MVALSPPRVGPGIDGLRGDLGELTVEAIEELLGPVAAAALQREQSVPALLATERLLDGATASSAAAELLRLFVLGSEVTRSQLDRALHRAGTAGLALRPDHVLGVGGASISLAVGQIVGAVAALLQRPTAEVAAEVLPMVRDLVRDGFLLPV